MLVARRAQLAGESRRVVTARAKSGLVLELAFHRFHRFNRGDSALRLQHLSQRMQQLMLAIQVQVRTAQVLHRHIVTRSGAEDLFLAL